MKNAMLVLVTFSFFLIVSCSDDNPTISTNINDGDSTSQDTATKKFTKNGFIFTTDDTIATIVDYVGTEKSIVIPETVTEGGNTYTITHIGDDSFLQKYLTSVVIPNTVISIGLNAFALNSLSYVNIPSSVISIGVRDNINKGAFYGNDSAFVGTLPDECPWFTDPNFNSEVLDKRITSDNWSDGFYTYFSTAYVLTADDFIYSTNGSNVTITKHTGHKKNIIIPETFSDNDLTYTITDIGDDAFVYNSVSIVKIPNSVTAIGDRAFERNLLEYVKIPNSVTTIGNSAFSGGYLTSLDIPNSVTIIGNKAFSNNYLMSIAIPNSVTIIGDGAFQNNDSTIVVIMPDEFNWFTDSSFAVGTEVPEKKITSANWEEAFFAQD